MSTPSIGFGPLKGPDVGTGTAYSERLVNGCLSTVGASLPPFTGRRKGDLHSIPVSGTHADHYVAEGEDGKQFSDDFSRADSPTVGKGWIQTSTSEWEIKNAMARAVGASQAMGQNFSNADAEITSILQGPKGNPGVYLYGAQEAGGGAGYFAQVDFDAAAGLTNVTLKKDGTQVAGHITGTKLAAPQELMLACDDGVVTVYLDGIMVISHTEATSKPSGTWCGISTGIAADNYFDSVLMAVTGTYVWLQVGGGTQAHQDVFGLTADGAQSKALTHSPLANSEHVSLNGLYQRESVDWTRTNKNINVLAAMDARIGDVLAVEYLYAVSTPAAPSVGPTLMRSGTNVQPVLPDGSGSGDFAVMFLAIGNNGSITNYNGWTSRSSSASVTHLASSARTFTYTLHVLTKTLASSTDVPTVSIPVSGSGDGQPVWSVAVFDGGGSFAEVNAGAVTGTTSATAPAVTSGSKAVRCWVSISNTTTMTMPSRGELNTTQLNTDVDMGMQLDADLTSATATASGVAGWLVGTVGVAL